MVDHGEVDGDTVTGRYDEAAALLDDLERLGISYVEVVELLEKEGLQKFEASWAELLDIIAAELGKAPTA